MALPALTLIVFICCRFIPSETHPNKVSLLNKREFKQRSNTEKNSIKDLCNSIDTMKDGVLTKKELAWAIQSRMKSHMQK